MSAKKKWVKKLHLIKHVRADACTTVRGTAGTFALVRRSVAACRAGTGMDWVSRRELLFLWCNFAWQASVLSVPTRFDHLMPWEVAPMKPLATTHGRVGGGGLHERIHCSGPDPPFSPPVQEWLEKERTGVGTRIGVQRTDPLRPTPAERKRCALNRKRNHAAPAYTYIQYAVSATPTCRHGAQKVQRTVFLETHTKNDDPENNPT